MQTIVFQIKEGEIPNLVDRIMAAANIFHVQGFEMDVVYGQADASILAQVDQET